MRNQELSEATIALANCDLNFSTSSSISVLEYVGLYCSNLLRLQLISSSRSIKRHVILHAFSSKKDACTKVDSEPTAITKFGFLSDDSTANPNYVQKECLK